MYQLEKTTQRQTAGFFPVRWEWDRVPFNREISAVFVHFVKSSKEHELDKLRKLALNQHFIQTFVYYSPSSDLIFWNLCIAHSIFVLKISTSAVSSKLGNFGPLLEKKRYYLALELGPYDGPKFTKKNPWTIKWTSEIGWLTSHATIFQLYMWRHRCAGGLKKKLYLRPGSQRHRHFVGFFNVSVQAPIRGQPFYGHSEKPPHFSRLIRHAWGYGRHTLDLTPRVHTGVQQSKHDKTTFGGRPFKQKSSNNIHLTGRPVGQGQSYDETARFVSTSIKLSVNGSN